MIPPDLLAQFEADYFGRLSVAEQQSLQESLRARPDWQEELRQYHQLWRGLNKLGEDQLRQNLANWENMASSTDEAELLEWYFQNQLSAENRQWIDEQRAANPAFAKRFEAYQKIYHGLDQLGETQFRTRMNEWEKETAPQASATDQTTGRRVALRSYRRVLAIAASVLLLIVAGLLWRNQANDPQALLDDLYTYPVTGNTLGNDSISQAEYLAIFDQAHQAFQQKNYESAVELFTTLSTKVPPDTFVADDLSYYQDNVEWMVVLSRFGAGKTAGDFSQRLRSIADNATHRFQEQAQKLSDQF